MTRIIYMGRGKPVPPPRRTCQRGTSFLAKPKPGIHFERDSGTYRWVTGARVLR